MLIQRSLSFHTEYCNEISLLHFIMYFLIFNWMSLFVAAQFQRDSHVDREAIAVAFHNAWKDEGRGNLRSRRNHFLDEFGVG